MPKRPNGLKKIPKDGRPSGTERRNVTRRAEAIQADGNAVCTKLACNKKKRRNRLEELGKKLNLPRSTIYQYAKERKITCVKLGDRYVLPDDVEQRIYALAFKNWVSEVARAVLGSGRASPTAAKERGRTSNVWLSPRQFAQRFDVGTSAVYGAVERGEVPAIRMGRHIRIPPDAIEIILHNTIIDH